MRKVFGLLSHSFQGTVLDTDLDGFMELIFVDMSGHVTCYHNNGDIMWSTLVSGSSEGVVIEDVNADGNLDVVLLTVKG